MAISSTKAKSCPLQGRERFKKTQAMGYLRVLTLSRDFLMSFRVSSFACFLALTICILYSRFLLLYLILILRYTSLVSSLNGWLLSIGNTLSSSSSPFLAGFRRYYPLAIE